MLIKLREYYKANNFLGLQYNSKVIDNLDPKKLGRVKCTIPKIFEGDKESLPWITPKFGAIFGASLTSGFFAVPEIGSEVVVSFPNKDIYIPVYESQFYHENVKFTEVEEDYPNTWVFKDGVNTLKVNKLQKEFKFTDANLNVVTLKDNIKIEHNSGTTIEVKPDGSIEIKAKGDIKADSDEKGKLVIGKDGKVALGQVGGSSTGGASALEIIAILEKLCDLLTICNPPGFGAPIVGADSIALLQADLISIKGNL